MFKQLGECLPPRGSDDVTWVSAPQNQSGRILAGKWCLLAENVGWGERKCRQVAQESGCRHFSSLYSSIHAIHSSSFNK